jgi:gliding motility-associated-like protein
MKKLFYLIFVLLLSANIQAQSNINADCISAIPLCSTPNFTFNATSGVGNVADIPSGNNVSNPSTNPGSSNAGCLLSGELKPQWLLITVGNAGNLEFIFGAGNSSNPQVGFYDWAMWPYTPATCANIQNNTLPPIRCNWNGSNSGGTGIASAANQPGGSSTSNFEPPLAVLPCQQFIICISNYSGVNTLVSFQSLGTASLSCNPSCISVNNPTLCSGSSSSIVAASSGNLSNISFSLNPGGLTSITPTFAISPSVNTSYTIFATGLNSSSVAVTQTAVSNVTVYSTPNAAPTTTQATCLTPTNAFNLGLTFTPASPIPNYTITWSTIPAGVNSATQSSSNNTITAGVYTATITTTGGCSKVTSFTIDAKPAPTNIVLLPSGPIYSITCFQPTVTINGVNATYNYTWTNTSIGAQTGPTATMNTNGQGTWSITAINPLSGCVATKTIYVGQNTVSPTSVITPTFQNITCNLASITTVTATCNQTVNIQHLFTSPQSVTYSANSYSTVYSPGSPGTYTYCITNMVNGCSSCQLFTVSANQGFPIYNISSPQNFTLGCTTKSVATVNIINASATNSNQIPTAGPISYTLLAPGASSIIPSGVLSGPSSYTVATPGTWTAVTKDNTSFCETRIPFSVLSNTQGPTIDSLIIPQNVLNCFVPQVTIQAISLTPNINYAWVLPSNITSPNNTLAVSVNTTAPNATLIANYTLAITDNGNTCVTRSVVPMVQNVYPPEPQIVTSQTEFSCKTTSIVLTNFSSSGIPKGSIFPRNLPIISYIWDAPSPQIRGELSTTYLAMIVGTYTMSVKDLNNGCTASTVITLADNKNYPVLSSGNADTLDCGATFATVNAGVVGSLNNLDFFWTIPSGVSVSSLTGSPIKVNNTGTFRVVALNTVNGCSTTGERRVVNGSLYGKIIPNDIKGFAPLTITFANASRSSGGTNNISSAWNFGNSTYSVTNSASISPQALYTQAGTYKVTTYISKGTCIDTSINYILVELPSALEIPNVFTPNNDNVNDVFLLKATNLEEISILIYDRWGHKVYELTSDKGNIAWDGKNQLGREVAEGTYLYILKAKGSDGGSYEKKGNITLIR